MTERIIDISDGPARLSARKGVLIIERDGDPVTVPLTELAVLVVSHPAVSITSAVFSGICIGGGSCVICDDQYKPAGMLLPLDGNYVQTERFAAQARASLPIKKQLWKQVVQAKIHAQARTLQKARNEDKGLPFLAQKVRSGDPENFEAQASRRYWPALFGEDFQRNPDIEDQNRLLNYGYAIVRALTARAICAAGLHPSLGLHHKNRYDSFCLASDLMEPFRPFVDCFVAGLVEQKGINTPLDKETKRAIIHALLSHRFAIDGEQRSFFDAMTRIASSLAAVYLGTRRQLLLPEY